MSSLGTRDLPYKHTTQITKKLSTLPNSHSENKMLARIFSKGKKEVKATQKKLLFFFGGGQGWWRQLWREEGETGCLLFGVVLLLNLK